MRLLIIGHHRMTNLVRVSLKRLLPAIETEVLLLETEDAASIKERFRQMEIRFDGVLFTGRTPYELLNGAVISQRPWSYIRRDAAQLLAALLKAGRLNGWDPARVSIDSYAPEEVSALCRETGIPVDSPITYSGAGYREGFLDDLTRFHRRNVASGRAQFCITGISSVFEALQAQGVPVLILDPTDESVRDALHVLELKRESRLAEDRQIVVLAVERDLPDEHALIRENEYQMALESMDISKEVYLFAQRVQAAVVERELGRFLLFTTKNRVELETDGFQSFSLLRDKIGVRFGSFSIGAGYGETAREAKYNANLGLLKARRAGGGCAFLVKSPQDIRSIASSQPEDTSANAAGQIDGIFQVAAEKACVSLNTIMKLQGLMDFERRNTFTSAELASLCHMTPRSANRLLEKLLEAGYAQIVGSSAQTKAGRPSRVVRLTFRKEEANLFSDLGKE